MDSSPCRGYKFSPHHWVQAGSGAHPASLHFQWVPGALSLGVKQLEHELTTHLHLVLMSRMHGAIPPLPNTPSWHGAQFKKHSDNFTFTLHSSDDNTVITSRMIRCAGNVACIWKQLYTRYWLERPWRKVLLDERRMLKHEYVNSITLVNDTD
jgi:hypothetical protein